MLTDSNHHESGSPKRKSFLGTSNNQMAAINQQLNNLGSINQQLSTLSLQLCGLNQQSQNLQNFQNIGSNFAQLIPTSPNANVMPNIVNHQPDIMQQQQHQQQQQQQQPTHDLFQSNQDLLNRLQSLSLSYTNGINNNNNNNNSINSYSPHNSFIYSNPSPIPQQQHQQQLSPNNNSINMSLLSSPPSCINLSPSPIFNRSSYSSSPMPDVDSLAMSMDHNLDRSSDIDTHFIRPLSQCGTLTTLDSSGNVKVVVPIANVAETPSSLLSLSPASSSTTTATTPTPVKKSDKRVTLPDFVTLNVTDESGNITNTRKLSATPTFITRSTSEKVPNRSQIMSEVQRTTWARHTTK